MPTTPLIREPEFTVVAAVYNVEKYLTPFLSSLKRQTYGINNLQIILVDDGSTDSSPSLLAEFAANHPTVSVFTKENGGQGSARNFGIAHATGRWVTFVDPDDFLANNYFQRIAQNIAKPPGGIAPEMVTSGFVSFYEVNRRYKKDHAMTAKFRYGTRVINMDVESDAIQLNVNSAFFKMQVVEDFGLRFDERIRPTFEDANFVAQYLLRVETPLLGLVPGAEYFYRKRADNSSAVGTSAGHPGRYTDVPRYGYLPLLEQSVLLKGETPEWLQQAILYDLSWAMKDDAAMESAAGSISDEVRAEFHDLARETLKYMSDEVLSSFSVTALKEDLRFVFKYGYAETPYAPTTFSRRKTDKLQGITQVSYRYTGEAPVEELFTDGQAVDPVFSKHRAIQFHGRTLAYERLVWVPTGKRIRVRLNGRSALVGNEVQRRTHTLERTTSDGMLTAAINRRPEHIRHPQESLWSRLGKRERKIRKALSRASIRKSVEDHVLSIGLHSAYSRRAFLDAWVFMDKDALAGDNAEHLYRYVRDNHPEIKALFVLKRNSADWTRLKDDGVKLVAHGSFRWKLLMLSASHYASSHIDQYVIRPFGNKYGEPRWRFTWLQHGVTKDDLSRWLNWKQIDLFVTASPAEYASIAGDATPYVFTGREVALTGFPRHDALRARRAALSKEAQDLILVMPTWRKHLVGPPVAGGNERGKLAGFMETEYARKYSELLNSPRLLQLANAYGLTVAFMPHPNMVRYLEDFDLPAGVQVFSFETTPVQDILARGRIMISDYSSLAFEAAVIEMPVVHFQFDCEEFFKGGHIGRKGYFDYESDGFGPVCQDLAEVEEAVSALLTPSPGEIDYRQRMRDTFQHHDQGNSQRVFEAMLALDKPAMRPAITVAVPVG